MHSKDKRKIKLDYKHLYYALAASCENHIDDENVFSLGFFPLGFLKEKLSIRIKDFFYTIKIKLFKLFLGKEKVKQIIEKEALKYIEKEFLPFFDKIEYKGKYNYLEK